MFLSFACAGNVQKTATPVKKATGMILLVDINRVETLYLLLGLDAALNLKTQ
jgi:hypothetical protein